MKFNKVKAKTALLATGQTQTSLSEKLQISRRWIGSAFNGGQISEKAARNIADALGVPLESLLDGQCGSLDE